MAERPTQKAIQYDRQLRLWGEHGQAHLEKASILLINANATAAETLKNLVLPGMGKFTILDGKKVDGADIGNNFFLDQGSMGDSRAKKVHDLLKELNPDVHGEYVEEDAVKLIQNSPSFFHKFTVVIASELPEPSLLALSNILWEQKIPLVVIRSYGFLGYVRVATQDHCIVDSHPENPFVDLRITEPFPALKAHAMGIDFDSLPSAEYIHVPYPIILIQFLERWRAEHNGEVPKTSADKNAFRDQLRAAGSKHDDALNFKEASGKAFRCWVPTAVPSDVRAIIDSPNCNVTASSTNFWFLAAALRDFVNTHGQGQMPLAGTIPDMTATSERFIALQTIYKAKADEDFAALASRVQAILQSVGKAADSIPESEIRLFCKHGYGLMVINQTSLADEYNAATVRKDTLTQNLNEENSNIVYYVLLRAVDRFQVTHGRLPGQTDDVVESDISKLKQCVTELLSEWGLAGNTAVKDDQIHEMCRYGGSELHTTAAFIGGVASQEVVKLATGQFVLMNNTYVFNGMNASAKVFTL